MSYKIHVQQTSSGYITFDSLEEAKEFLEGDMELGAVVWTQCDDDIGEPEKQA